MNLSTHEIPCIILCGGRSSRMGEDKALLPFSYANSLAQYQHDRLKPYFKEVYISTKTNKFDFDAKLILDEQKDEHSPIVALKSIFENLKDESIIFIITVDTPLVKIETINKLIENSKDTDITVAKTSRVHNLCGVFKISSLNMINEMLKNNIHKVGFLLKNMNSKYLSFQKEDEFINLNDKEQYFKAKDIIS